MPDWFLSAPEKERVSKWRGVHEDHSLSSRVLEPLWNAAFSLVPPTVAPNILSLAGLLCAVQAWYACYRYMESHPVSVSVAASLLVFAYQTLDALDGKQARRTRNESPVGELFDLACDGVAAVFVTLVVCEVLAIHHVATQWYLVQSVALLWLNLHVRALVRGRLSFGLLSGPGEAVFGFQCVVVARAVFGLEALHSLLAPVAPYYDVTNLARDFYYLVACSSLAHALFLPSRLSSTRKGLLLCLSVRCVPAALIYAGWSSVETGLIEVISDGLYMSILACDLVLAKMARRDLHPWVMISVMFSMFSYLSTFLLVAAYYASVFYELSAYMGLPMFSLVVNVYVDGVYDLLHVGHQKIFMRALEHGNRLFVGVCTDKDVASYKRYPIMTLEERMAAVSICKGVYKVVVAPFPGIPEEFIAANNIHVVCHSTEYDSEDDIYYAVPRKMGITRVLSRTDGISTSALIRRVKAYKMD